MTGVSDRMGSVPTEQGAAPRAAATPVAAGVDADDQLVLLPPAKARRRARSSAEKVPPPDAVTLPVARLLVDVSPPHLDRPFDYLVPEPMSAAAQPGVRVKVRFAGREVEALVLERLAATDHEGRLSRLSRVVSPVPVLTAEVATLVRAVADRWAGTAADVLRAAVPPRHARAETAVLAAEADALLDPQCDGPAAAGAGEPAAPPDPGPWSAYRGGPALVTRLAAGRQGPVPRAVWTATAGQDWPAALAVLVAAARAGGRGVLWLVPDARDVEAAASALREVLDEEVGVLTADLGPAARFRAFLRVLRGHDRVVVGTRAAVFAPVQDLGLVVVWDDGDDLYEEPHAPGWHAREVAVMRSQAEGAALVLGSYSRSVEAAALVAEGTAREVVADRATMRARSPRVRGLGDDADLARDEAARTARLPHLAWATAREGLARGPVLVQVPRRGYVPALACRRCRELARCEHCHGPLAATSGHAVPTCRWCARPAGTWRCPACGDSHLRAVAVGAGRTAEELGRAFPGVVVRTSGRDEVLDVVPGSPALVVATPGAEPRAEGGYAAALLLDGRVLLDRPDLRAAEEAVRRWGRAVALVRPAAEGGAVVVLADASLAPVQALVRADPAGFAAHELAERASLGLPPTRTVAALTGAPDDVAAAVAALALPAEARTLGPVPLPQRRTGAGPGTDGPTRVRTLVTVPREEAAALSAALREMAAGRSARRAGGPVQLRVDPVTLG